MGATSLRAQGCLRATLQAGACEFRQRQLIDTEKRRTARICPDAIIQIQVPTVNATLWRQATHVQHTVANPSAFPFPHLATRRPFLRTPEPAGGRPQRKDRRT